LIRWNGIIMKAA